MPLFRDQSHVPPDYLHVVEYVLEHFSAVYHLPTGTHDLHLLETGRISDSEFFRRICARYEAEGHPRMDPALVERYVFGREVIVCAEMLDAVRQIHDAGYRTAMLTNISRGGGDLWRRLIPHAEIFDVVIDSSEVGMRKPDPAIFRLTCERLRVRPEEALFIDDLSCNIEGAASLGIETIECRDPQAVAAALFERVLGQPAPAGTGTAPAE